VQEAKILVLVGMPGAGKSTCVDYLTDKGIPNVYFGGVVVDETKRRYGKVSEELERSVREDLRAKEGKGAIAKRIIAKIDQLADEGNKRIVADGLYSWTEYKIFKERWGDNAIIVAITAPRHVRHERLANRPVRPFTDEEVTAREYAEIENIEKGGPIANADYTLVNETDPEDLLKQLDKVLTKTHFLE
jgi:dephospho-CoA kinase